MKYRVFQNIWYQATKQATCSLNREKIWRNWVRSVAVVKTFLTDLMSSLIKKDVIRGTLFNFFVFINHTQFVKHLCMFVKFFEWKFTTYTFLKMHSIFKNIISVKSYSKSKWCKIWLGTLYLCSSIVLQVMLYDVNTNCTYLLTIHV